jgi:hypothetical protein
MIFEGTPEQVALAGAVVRHVDAETSDISANAAVTAAKAGLWKGVTISLASLGIGGGAGLVLLAYSFIPERVVIHDPPAIAAPPATQAPPKDQPRPTPGQLQPDALPASRAKVITNFVIFKTVPVSENGEVQSGWRYEDSNQPLPSFQFCNFVQRSPNGLDTLVKLGVDGHMELPKTKLRGVDLEAVSANCVWHPNVKSASAK